MSASEIQDLFIEKLKAEGLVLVPETIAQISLDVFAQQRKLLNRKTLTPYIISKFKLIPGVSTIRTVKNMTLDGRIENAEFFIDTNGKMQISTMAVKRLRNECS